MAAPYERRRPEETTLYQVVQDHIDTFFAQVEQETGAGLPQFVKDEFEAFVVPVAWRKPRPTWLSR
jgi:F420-dependent methylenetetrahydromethanopterin dehydrogenase